MGKTILGQDEHKDTIIIITNSRLIKEKCLRILTLDMQRIPVLKKIDSFSFPHAHPVRICFAFKAAFLCMETMRIGPYTENLRALK